MQVKTRAAINSAAYFSNRSTGRSAMGRPELLEILESRLLLSGVLSDVDPANHPPLLTTVATLSTAMADNPFPITFDQLLAASNATDVDGDTLEFEITALGAGTQSLTLNGTAVTTFPTTISLGGAFVWTPKPTSKGKVTAFSIKAFDGTVASAKPVAVTVDTILQTTVTIVANKPKASELNPTTTGMGQFTIKRAGGDPTQPLNIPFTIDNSDPNSAVNSADYTLQSGNTIFSNASGVFSFAANQTSIVVNLTPIDDLLTEPPETAKIVLSPPVDATYFTPAPKNTATVTIADFELSPDSIAGDTITATITSGTAPYATKGTYQLALSATSDDRYLLIGGTGVVSSSGTYSYVRSSATAATIMLHDSITGDSQGTITFTTPTKATFSISPIEGLGLQMGTMAFVLPSAASFAPVSLIGQSATAHIKSGTGALAATGTAQFAFAQASDHFAFAGAAANLGDYGTYNYQKLAPNVGFITYTDVDNNSASISLIFTSATSASYVLTTASGDAQRGTLSFDPAAASGFAPASLANKSLAATITGGAAPFAAHGAYLMDILSTTYTLTGVSPIADSTGSIAYEQLTPTIGFISFDDSTFGPSFGVLDFTSATKASYVLSNAPTLGWQRGTMTFNPNLLVNGDFSAGNTGFSTSYPFSATDPPNVGAHYTVDTSPINFNSGMANFGDHTTGTGQMLIVDGSTTANTIIWQEIVTVAPNTTYSWTAFVASCGESNGSGHDPSPASLVFNSNLVQVGSTLAVPSPNGQWIEFSGTVNSGASKSLALSIVDSNTTFVGNDFVMDDLSFSAIL